MPKEYLHFIKQPFHVLAAVRNILRVRKSLTQSCLKCQFHYIKHFLSFLRLGNLGFTLPVIRANIFFVVIKIHFIYNMYYDQLDMF